MNRLIELRKEKHLNQVGLAMKLNVSQKMISSYERGTHQPSIETLIRMSKIFNVSVDYLIGNTDIKMQAEKFSENGLTEKEIELLDIFKSFNCDKQNMAIGMLIALKKYEQVKNGTD